MDVIKSVFEYPLPKIAAETSKIVVETDFLYKSAFKIKNMGGGILLGSAVSYTRYLTLDNSSFKGNDVCINYSIDTGSCFKGQIIKSKILIISNGGEIVIPVIIKVSEGVFTTFDGYKIYSVKDLYSYSKKNQFEARRIFCSNDFLLWLERINFPNSDIVENFVKDPNKERALDNFFILAKLKARATFSAFEKNINMKVPPFLKNSVGAICLNKQGTGFIQDNIFLKNRSPWIILEKNKITSSDFNSENKCFINYKTDIDKMCGIFSSETVVFEQTGVNVKINVSIMPEIVCKLSREFYDFEDFGFLEIKNNYQNQININLFSKDNSIKFEKIMYCADGFETVKIPFEVKVSSIFSKQMSITKKIYSESYIGIETDIAGKHIRKIKKVILGHI